MAGSFTVLDPTVWLAGIHVEGSCFGRSVGRAHVGEENRRAMDFEV